MITSIIFSKDRPLQLDLTIQSIKKNFNQCDTIEVIYNYSEEFSCTIPMLQRSHPEIIWCNQTNSDFYDILLGSIAMDSNRHICFFTDDNIVYAKTDVLEFSKEISCFSLRLGMNTNKRDFNGKLHNDILPIDVHQVEPYLLWNRMSIPAGGYWNYPLSVDGHIFHYDLIYNIVQKIRMMSRIESTLQTPNGFEKMMQRFFFEVPALMACNKFSTVFNSPNNRVQNDMKNRSGDKYAYGVNDLLDLYLLGKRINIDKLIFPTIYCPHQEIDILEGLYDI